VTEGYVRFWTK